MSELDNLLFKGISFVAVSLCVYIAYLHKQSADKAEKHAQQLRELQESHSKEMKELIVTAIESMTEMTSALAGLNRLIDKVILERK